MLIIVLHGFLPADAFIFIFSKKMCVEQITRTDDIEMEIVRAQVYFDTNFPAQGNNLIKKSMSKILRRDQME